MSTKPSKCFFDLSDSISIFEIDNESRTAMCFTENLAVCLKDNQDKSVGNCTITAESFGPQNLEFLVHIQFCIDVKSHIAGSKIISSFTDRFHCLEEKRTEYVRNEESCEEKMLFMGIKGDSYYVKRTRRCPHDESTEYEDLPFAYSSDLISEGANIMLMRYLALINYEGTLTFHSLTIDAKILFCRYKCTAAEDIRWHNQRMRIYTIERTMEKDNEIIETIRIYLTPEGRIIKHNWLLSFYFLSSHLCSDPIVPHKTTLYRDEWCKDIEMLSKYLDRKCYEMIQLTRYLADHSEIKNLIADYIHTLLIVKPLRVTDFTIQYFKSFATHPKSEYSTVESSKASEKECEDHCKPHCDCQEEDIRSSSIKSHCSTASQSPRDVVSVIREKTDSNTTVYRFNIFEYEEENAHNNTTCCMHNKLMKK